MSVDADGTMIAAPRPAAWWTLSVVAALVAGLGGYALGGATRSGPPDAVASDAVMVVGATTCRQTSYEEVEQQADGVEIIEERFECTLELSDARASGTEELVVTSRIRDWTQGGIWTADGVLTTELGTWRGSGQGTFSLTTDDLLGQPVSPPVNQGEIRYVGEGGHDGLTMHLYFVGTNFRESRAGWISSGTGEAG